MTFSEYLIVGSYLFSAGAYVFGWKILQALDRIEKQLGYNAGVVEGQEHEKRITRLELR